jgi:hypothetical protein
LMVSPMDGRGFGNSYGAMKDEAHHLPH